MGTQVVILEVKVCIRCYSVTSARLPQDFPDRFSMRGGRLTLVRWRGRRIVHRRLCTVVEEPPTSLGGLGGASGSRVSTGSGKSLMGSALRSLTSEQLAALAAGEEVGDTTLAGGDVLMEVLAEDHRRSRVVEYRNEPDEHSDENSDHRSDQQGSSQLIEQRRGDALGHEPLRGRRMAHRRYLTPGRGERCVGDGTVFERSSKIQLQRLDVAMEVCFGCFPFSPRPHGAPFLSASSQIPADTRLVFAPAHCCFLVSIHSPSEILSRFSTLLLEPFLV